MAPIVTVFSGTYYGSSGFSVGGFVSIVNAPEVEKISGDGSAVGGSATFPIPDVPIGVAFGAEKVNAYDGEETYEGVSVSTGISPPSAGVEYHMTKSDTYLLGKFNLFDKYDEIYSSRMKR